MDTVYIRLVVFTPGFLVWHDFGNLCDALTAEEDIVSLMAATGQLIGAEVHLVYAHNGLALESN